MARSVILREKRGIQAVGDAPRVLLRVEEHTLDGTSEY